MRADLTSRLAVTAAAACVVLLGHASAQDGAQDEGGYARTPARLRPFAGAGRPDREFFTAPPQFRGPGREADVAAAGAVRIGVLVPTGGRYGSRGVRMLEGTRLAVEEANAAGGYADGMPFELSVRDESEAWGAAANAVVDLASDERVVALVGALDDSASHVVTRVLLKVEIPLVNTGGVDPTLTEHAIPWLVRVRPDDRQACYGLARRMFEQDGHRRVVVFRENGRYARVGIQEFMDAARRLGHPVALEVRFERHETAWAPLAGRVAAAKPDAVLLWGEGDVAARALREMRRAGVEAPVYGPERLGEREFLDEARDAADGVVFAYPFRPEGKTWTAFAGRYRDRTGNEPDAVSAHAYDGTCRLIQAIRDAGPNRVLVRDALFARPAWDGVSGEGRFDVTGNVVREMVLGHVQDGRARFD